MIISVNYHFILNILRHFLKHGVISSTGYYCPSNTSDYMLYPCPSGYYCPENTTSSSENPCPIGTFNPDTEQTNSSACLLCTGGQYCSGTGLSAPTGNCR